MPLIPFATNFLAGSLISLLMPLGLLLSRSSSGWAARSRGCRAIRGRPRRRRPSVTPAQHDAARAQIDTGSGGP